MENTFSIFKDRKEEIEFYFSVLLDIENTNSNIHTIDNTRFYKIMKSNFLLMLYNLVEACIVSGMLEIYESLKDEKCSYNQVIKEIQNIWSKYKINDLYGKATKRGTYEKRVQQIIQDVITDSPIILSKNALEVKGNLNAKKIKEICNQHKIRYQLKTKGECLEQLRRERNSLSHGDVSFSDCAKDLTSNDLEKIKDEVFLFLKGILKGMEEYYNLKLYKIQ